MKNIFRRAFSRGFFRMMAVMTLLAISASLASAAQSGDYFYEITPNGSARIDEYTGPGGAVNIPTTLDGRTVVGIGRYAFSGATNLTAVNMPDTVLYLENYVFNECENLTTVTIGNGLNSIGFRVFNFCDSLTTIAVSAGNTNFSSANGVLFNKSQQSLLLVPAGRTGAYAIPAGVTNIADEAMYTCRKITGVSFPDSLKNIGEAAFWGCTNLGAITLPTGLTSIGNDAFWNCSGMTSITFPATLQDIGSFAFYECASLPAVTVPGAVTNIGAWAFGRCASLASISVATANPHYSSLDGVLFNKEQTVLVQCPGGKTDAYIIPGTVTNIAGDAQAEWPASSEGLGGFSWCASLTRITIPGSVTSIGRNAFLYCTGLTNLYIPETVEDIGFWAFAECSNLRSINIPDNVKNIPYGSFSHCSSLTTFEIPDSVTNIEASAFSSCTDLATVKVGYNVERIGEAAFWGCTNLNGVYFRGNAPVAEPNIFGNADNVIAYRLPGTTDWGAMYAERPTAFWNPEPDPQIKANGRSGTVHVGQQENVVLTVTMAAGGYYGVDVDWWVVAIPSYGPNWYYLDTQMQWRGIPANQMHALHPANQGPLVNLFEPVAVMPGRTLPPGAYVFYFVADQMDGILNYPEGPYVMDYVTVLVP